MNARRLAQLQKAKDKRSDRTARRHAREAALTIGENGEVK